MVPKSISSGGWERSSPIPLSETCSPASSSRSPGLTRFRRGGGIPAGASGRAGPLRLRRGERERFVVLTGADEASGREAWRRAVEDLGGEAAAPIVVREVPGRERNGRYYPDISGLLLGENYYPISYLKPMEGIAYVSLGLGAPNRAHRGALRFSPAHPDLMPDFSTPADILRNSQRNFLALDPADPSAGPLEFDLGVAMKDGALAPVGSVYSRENQALYPGVGREGVKVVTFAPMLRGGGFPLAKILKELLDRFREAFREPLAVEFAVSLGGGSAGGREHRFIVERVTAQWTGEEGAPEPLDLESPGDDLLCSSGAALGNGTFPGIRDILCVCPDRFDVSKSHDIGREVGRFDRGLREGGRPYVLIGSGRWGTSDRWLGVPVTWGDISGARIQVEVGLEDFNVESSRGTHFFRELTFHRIGALHIGPGNPRDRIDWDYLQTAPTASEGEFVRHIALDEPLRIRIDGRRGRAAIWKPPA
ncbi:MAG: hypothetical protein ABIK65_12255 [Candidatus Eisenbacteria bacterium]